MDRYRVVSTLSLFAGSVVGLSEAQHAPRAAQLRARDDGSFEVTAPVQFKAGEVLGIADAPKALLGRVLEPVDGNASAPTDEAKPAAQPPRPARKRAGS